MGNKHREVKSVMVLSPRFAAPGTLSPEPAGPPRGCRSLISGRQRSLGDSSATVTTLHSRGAGLRRRGGGVGGPPCLTRLFSERSGGGCSPPTPLGLREAQRHPHPPHSGAAPKTHRGILGLPPVQCGRQSGGRPGDREAAGADTAPPSVLCGRPGGPCPPAASGMKTSRCAGRACAGGVTHGDTVTPMDGQGVLVCSPVLSVCLKIENLEINCVCIF